MLRIIDDRIYMVRGDDEALDVKVMGADGEIALGETETLTLTVRELPTKESPMVFASTSAPGSTRIVIRHEDTAHAEYGKYSADIQMMTTEGYRKTVWPVFDEESIPKAEIKNSKNFIILPEVSLE